MNSAGWSWLLAVLRHCRPQVRLRPTVLCSQNVPSLDADNAATVAAYIVIGPRRRPQLLLPVPVTVC